MDLHAVLVVIHAVAATAALVVGFAALRYPRLLTTHLALLVVMTASLAGAVVIDLLVAAPGRWVFVGLLFLAVAMCVSSARAVRSTGRDPAAGTEALGFSLISLVTGFVAVSVIGAGWPMVAVTVSIALPILVGRQLVRRLVLSRSRSWSPISADPRIRRGRRTPAV